MTQTTIARVTVEYRPDQDSIMELASWGPAVDRRLEELTTTLRRLLGRGYEVELDTSANARCSGATQELRVVVPKFDGEDHEAIAEEALLAAWAHCTDRWNRAMARRSRS